MTNPKSFRSQVREKIHWLCYETTTPVTIAELDMEQNKRVKCFLCKKPIHIKEWGGIISLPSGKDGFFHNTLHCLILMIDSGLIKEPSGTK